MRVGSGKQFVRSHVARDLYFYLNYALLLFYYIYYFDYIIKIAPDEFDIIKVLVYNYITPYYVSYPLS